MPRTPRIAPGDWVFHVLNRANGKGLLFDGAPGYREFLGILEDCAEIDSMRILAYCLMPNHWHLLLWPRREGDLARFVHRVTLRHTHRWHVRHQSTGRGHLYQARYKSFAVRTDRHLVTVCRYIERNPLRANLVDRSESWPWSSAAAHALSGLPSGSNGTVAGRANGRIALASLPVPLPTDWTAVLHAPQTQSELDAMRSCVQRGVPFGDRGWCESAALRLGLRLGTGRRGRPRKDAPPSA